MIGVVLLLAALAGADSGEDLARQRQVVAQAASQVAEARAGGARRSEIAERMRAYREEAARLEALQAEVRTPVAEVRRARLVAVSRLAESLAEGKRDDDARAVLDAWLGEPTDRAALLDEAVTEAIAVNPGEIRRGLLLDVVEQADALSVVLAYDVDGLQRRADELEVRALGLRRRGPGQAAALSDEVEAVRLEQQADLLEQQAEGLQAIKDAVRAVRTRAAAALEEPA